MVRIVLFKGVSRFSPTGTSAQTISLAEALLGNAAIEVMISQMV
jgi:hypothetical protein